MSGQITRDVALRRVAWISELMLCQQIEVQVPRLMLHSAAKFVIATFKAGPSGQCDELVGVGGVGDFRHRFYVSQELR